MLICILTTAGLYLLSGGGVYAALCRQLIERPQTERMRNVTVEARTSAPERLAVYVPEKTGATEAPQAEPAALIQPPLLEPAASPAPAPGGNDADTVLETTIEGGMRIKNETKYWVSATELLAQGTQIRLPAGQPQILIIHTHASEAYTQAGLDRYTPSDLNRTEDTQFNVVRIGDELSDILSAAGLQVIHDRGIYDYPSYTGSYTRSGEAIEQYLAGWPSIRIVFDIHRDALGSDGVVYKTMAEEEGTVASQVMLLVGTDESGLAHPNWRENLALALYLQNAVNSGNPTLMRPIALVPQRYNQHLTPGSLILEVGSSGNTLREALAAIRLFGAAAAPALLELVEEG